MGFKEALCNASGHTHTHSPHQAREREWEQNVEHWPGRERKNGIYWRLIHRCLLNHIGERHKNCEVILAEIAQIQSGYLLIPQRYPMAASGLHLNQSYYNNMVIFISLQGLCTTSESILSSVNFEKKILVRPTTIIIEM